MTAIDRIRTAKAEQEYLLQCLELWDVAKVAGYAAEEVKAFSFRPDFLTREQRQQDRRARFNHRHGQMITQGDWHNCVRLHTGELKPIPLTRRPQRDSNS